jgi:hypothetical protein
MVAFERNILEDLHHFRGGRLTAPGGFRGMMSLAVGLPQ